MLNGVTWMPKELTLAAMKKVRNAGYCRENPPRPGTLLPFTVAFADAACRGRGLHKTMSVCPRTKISTMVQAMHSLAPIAVIDGVVGVTMQPDRFLWDRFDPKVIRAQWVPFLQFLSPGIQVEQLAEVPRDKWYPFVGGGREFWPPGLREDFEVDAVAQTSARQDFGNLILNFNLAAGPLATLPRALSPELVVAMNEAGHSNTVMVLGMNRREALPVSNFALYVDHTVEEVVDAITSVWNPDEGFEQPAYRAARVATAVSERASESLLATLRDGPWAQLGAPAVLTIPELRREASEVPGTIIVICRKHHPDFAVLTNGVSREPDLPPIPTELLPLKQL